jgi:hypothetical protein
MRPWWPESPLRGMSLAERRRLARLMRSEERIDDPQDAESVHALIEYNQWYQDSVGRKFLDRFGPWFAIPWWVFVTAVAALRGSWILAVLSILTVAIYIASIPVNRSMRRRVQRTAQLNGWD